MKAATGELNLTLVTVIAIGAILAFFVAFVWPSIRGRLTNDTNQITSTVVNSANYVEFVDYAG